MSVFLLATRQKLGIDRGGGIPILMYHSISPDPEVSTSPYFRINVSPKLFRRQIARLSELGYSTISLERAVQLFSAGGSGLGKVVVITFDDGFEDVYHEGFPVLDEFGYGATVFLATDFVGGRFKNRRCVDWAQIREMKSRGILFGSHTKTHPVLTDLSEAAILNELADSKKAIEDGTGERVVSFSYPFAFPQANKRFVAGFRSLMKECGYENGVSTIIGKAKITQDPFFLARLPVNSADDLLLFEAKLSGAYDWLGAIQYVKKRLRRGESQQ